MAQSKQKQKEKMAQVVAALEAVYPDASCALLWQGDPWKLLVMGRLSAQCTDARVNLVSVSLFETFPTPASMAYADVKDIEAIVRPCGLFHTKAADIKEASRQLVETFGGVLPSDMESLLSLRGVGRKIAHLLRGDVFHLPAIVTDTHCIRICGKLGFYPETEKTPHKIEKILTEIVSPEKSSDFCHRIVQFGRDICMARSPRCEECPLAHLCSHQEKAKKCKS